MKILLVEDDHRASEYLTKGLRELGHAVEQAFDGESGRTTALAGGFDVLILDRMLPKLDGLEIVKTLRQAGSTVPILILSALDEVDERVQGLRAGGDDYLAKPYHLEELAARIDALARRHGDVSPTGRLKVVDLELDSRARKVSRNGRKIDLTAREFQLLEFLMRHTGQVVTRTMILEVLRQDYIRTAWAKGLSEKLVVVRHALRNALIPVVTLIGLQAPLLIGGAVIMEQIFVIPGMGLLLLDAVSQRDYPIITGVFLIVGVAVMFINLIVDLSYGLLDPKVRYR